MNKERNTIYGPHCKCVMMYFCCSICELRHNLNKILFLSYSRPHRRGKRTKSSYTLVHEKKCQTLCAANVDLDCTATVMQGPGKERCSRPRCRRRSPLIWLELFLSSPCPERDSGSRWKPDYRHHWKPYDGTNPAHHLNYKFAKFILFSSSSIKTCSNVDTKFTACKIWLCAL